MLLALVFALCVCGCVQGAAIQGQRPDVPTYKLVGKVGGLEVRQYDPMTLASKVGGGLNLTPVDNVLDNIDASVLTEQEDKPVNDSTVNLQTVPYNMRAPRPGACRFPFRHFSKWYFNCQRHVHIDTMRYRNIIYYWCGNNRDFVKRQCTEEDRKVTARATLNKVADILDRIGIRPNVVRIAAQWAGDELIALNPFDLEQVLTSHAAHQNYASQAAQSQDAPVSLTQYPSTTVLVKRLADEEEGTYADDDNRLQSESLLDQIKSAVDESRRGGVIPKQVLLAVNDQPANGEAAREIWIM